MLVYSNGCYYWTSCRYHTLKRILIDQNTINTLLTNRQLDLIFALIHFNQWFSLMAMFLIIWDFFFFRKAIKCFWYYPHTKQTNKQKPEKMYIYLWKLLILLPCWEGVNISFSFRCWLSTHCISNPKICTKVSTMTKTHCSP